MKKIKIIFVLILFNALIASCTKENNNNRKFDGEYDIIKYEQTWYTNNTADSTLTQVENLGWIGLENNGEDFKNIVTPGSTFIPRSFLLQGITLLSEINWTTDRGSAKTIGFFGFTNLTDEFVRYTVNKSFASKKCTWTYLQQSGGNILYKEVITLKKR
jgi:hypothetical protein